MRLGAAGVALVFASIVIIASHPAPAGDPFSLSGITDTGTEMQPPLAWAFPGLRTGIQTQYLSLNAVRSYLDAGNPGEAYQLATAAITASLRTEEQIIAPLVLVVLKTIRDGGPATPAAVEFLAAHACLDRFASPTALDFSVRGGRFAVSPASIIARALHYGFERDLPFCEHQPEVRSPTALSWLSGPK